MAGIDIIIMVLLKLKTMSVLTGSYVLPLTMAIYSLEPLLFFKALSFKGIGIINALWDVISTILIALIGSLFFGETITPTNWFGILLCTAGIILVGL
jgi:multidrug transporter EmrE-like cation transporter